MGSVPRGAQPLSPRRCSGPAGTVLGSPSLGLTVLRRAPAPLTRDASGKDAFPSRGTWKICLPSPPLRHPAPPRVTTLGTLLRQAHTVSRGGTVARNCVGAVWMESKKCIFIRRVAVRPLLVHLRCSQTKHMSIFCTCSGHVLLLRVPCVACDRGGHGSPGTVHIVLGERVAAGSRSTGPGGGRRAGTAAAARAPVCRS